MCGIWGQLNFDGGTADDAVARAALAALAHRGPDAGGVWRGEGIVLGARRLSVIDLATGDQPIVDAERGCSIVYNGELYNFRELRRRLEQHGLPFATDSDTEVVLRAYQAWGFDCVKRFDGMFALAIWDGRAQTLFLARDRVGEKPLYYYRDARRLVFASEIKAILADPSVPRQLGPRGLANYLAFDHAVAPHTIFEGVHKLLPAHTLVCDATTVMVTPYWEVCEPASPEPAQRSLDGWGEELRELLDEAVRSRLVADVPVGAFLSGGLDSSTVVALMQRHHAAPVKTFSLGFAGGRRYDELPDAARVARALGTDHAELRVEHVDLLAELRTLVWHYDEPFSDPAAFPVLLLSRFAREHVKVALVGDGGDELFGGYRRHAADRLAPLWKLLPEAVSQRWAPGLTGRLPRLRRLKQAVATLAIHEPARRYAAWLALFTPEMRAELLVPGVGAALEDWDPAWACARHYYGLSEACAADHVNRLMYVDLKTWLPDKMLEKTDKASMAVGLEVRAPLLDHRIVELAFRIPSRFKLQGLRGKRVLRRAVRDLVPGFVLRKPKRGFAVPLDPWFRKELHGFARELLLDPRTARRGLLDTGVVERLLGEHASGRHVWDRHIFALVNLELWARLYLDGEGVNG